MHCCSLRAAPRTSRHVSCNSSMRCTSSGTPSSSSGSQVDNGGSARRASSHRLGLQPALHILWHAVQLVRQPVEQRRQRLAVGERRRGAAELVKVGVCHRDGGAGALGGRVLQQQCHEVHGLWRELLAEDL
eukprot:366501-Chlamydomonas_euryale.AAC.32